MALAQSRLDQVRDLVNQFEQLVGYAISVNDAEITELANEKVQTLFEIGQYFGRGSNYNDVFRWSPWAQYGMTSPEYMSKLTALGTTFQALTGQAAPQDVIDRALRQTMGVISGPQFEQWLLAQDSIKNTYGWLKYGLDFQQFQQRKLEMRTQLGRDLTDQEAAVQLQHLHQAQGTNQSVGPTPTLSQQEKKQANVGVGQSVVR